MKTAVHLLDDFAMGGVMRALSLFEEPEFDGVLQSRVEPVPAMARLAKRYNADLIVVHIPPSWRRMPWIVSLRALNPNAQIVHVEHSYTQGFERHMVANTKRFRAMMRMAFTFVDRIVCVSHAQRHWMVAATGAPADKFRTIHPWSGREDLLELAPSGGLEGRTIRLAAYGRFAEVKNFQALVDAVALLGSKTCSLALGGSGPLQAELEQAAAQADNVQLVGQVEDVRAFLDTCDAVIVPSLYEAFGLVATEARLAGRPVLVADVDGLPEQAISGGMVAQCDSTNAIAFAIGQFAQLPLERMAQQARVSALGHRNEVITGWESLVALG